MSTVLKYCPFFGGAADFHDDKSGWIRITCLLCGASTNPIVKAMDDCKTLLAEQWNMRFTEGKK